MNNPLKAELDRFHAVSDAPRGDLSVEFLVHCGAGMMLGSMINFMAAHDAPAPGDAFGQLVMDTGNYIAGRGGMLLVDENEQNPFTQITRTLKGVMPNDHYVAAGLLLSGVMITCKVMIDAGGEIEIVEDDRLALVYCTRVARMVGELGTDYLHSENDSELIQRLTELASRPLDELVASS